MGTGGSPNEPLQRIIGGDGGLESVLWRREGQTQGTRRSGPGALGQKPREITFIHRIKEHTEQAGSESEKRRCRAKSSWL